MRTSDFDYELPEELIAQTPAPRRDASRLLVLQRGTERLEHRPSFRSFAEFLSPGDLLVLNDSRVIPARLRGERLRSGDEPAIRPGANSLQTPAQFEILLLEETAPNRWWTMMRPGKKARTGTRIRIRGVPGAFGEITARVEATNDEGHRLVQFEGIENILEALDAIGEVPLPPYIHRAGSGEMSADVERYQTVYADRAGSVAAPTAGLHFTEAFMEELATREVRVTRLTLHVGLGTFAPVKAETLAAHHMHEERYELSSAAVGAIEETKAAGKRVVAVGTTSLRVLETVAAKNQGRVLPCAGRTRLFVYPPFEFSVADALLTNFHLPRSTLLMLVSAFAAPGSTCGIQKMRRAYQEAIQNRYRFFSYGDAMLIL